jgi:hypothetical protein
MCVFDEYSCPLYVEYMDVHFIHGYGQWLENTYVRYRNVAIQMLPVTMSFLRDSPSVIVRCNDPSLCG